MEELINRIRAEGKHVGRGILKVDSFLNHQVDPVLMKKVGEEFARRFAAIGATKVLTAETSGIAPALATATALGIPVIFARKSRPLTMPGQAYREMTFSPTHDREAVPLLVSPEFLAATDRILIIDDFLSTAQTILALTRIVAKAGAQVVGIGTVIEKAFEKGREALKNLNVPIESLAIIEKLDNGGFVFKE
jgi:xanthine phosphoribosyltransferase